jgi:hypothetical protein
MEFPGAPFSIVALYAGNYRCLSGSELCDPCLPKSYPTGPQAAALFYVNRAFFALGGLCDPHGCALKRAENCRIEAGAMK